MVRPRLPVSLEPVVANLWMMAASRPMLQGRNVILCRAIVSADGLSSGRPNTVV